MDHRGSSARRTEGSTLVFRCIAETCMLPGMSMGSSSPRPALSPPLQHFLRWFDEAVAAGVPEPQTMALATATPEGRPSVRFVFFRGVSEGGIRFFTNRESRKAIELAANPYAAVAFHWPSQNRQARL